MKSIITEYTDYCLICGKPRTDLHHLCFNKANRRLSDADGLVIPLCKECHTLIHQNGKVGTMSKLLGQLAWEKEYGSKEDFRARYGVSYR